MATGDTMTRLTADMLAGFGLLTRLPLPQPALPPRAAAAWSWPLVGLAVGGLSALVAWGALTLGLSSGVAAAVALATSALATGALHEDGLADTADGLFGGWSRERRLEIMKDSHIGSYGTLALVLVTLAKWAALTELLSAGGLLALPAAAAASRAAMAALMALMPNARGSGLSQTVGRPDLSVAGWAALLALGVLLGLGPAPFGMAVGVVVAALVLQRLAMARIGGQTGDILGATQQMAELAALAAASAALGSA